MAVHPTRDMLVAAYEFLRTTSPFRAWHLPPAESVKFAVLKRKRVSHGGKQAEYVFDGRHEIRITDINHTTAEALLKTLAHEMVHMKQHLNGGNCDHGMMFNRLADRVCKIHLWDRGQF